MTAGEPSALAATIGERVSALLAAAEREAADIRSAADRDTDRAFADARAEGRRSTERAEAQVALAVKGRAERLIDLRHEIVRRAESLIAEAEHPEQLRRQLETLLLALAHAGKEVAELAPAPPAASTAVPTSERSPDATSGEPLRDRANPAELENPSDVGGDSGDHEERPAEPSPKRKWFRRS